MRKYILLLITAITFGQASNQMVTFTQAQSLGFALQAGQSHVTSNQCMTKTDALAKYSLNASFMGSYASNQLVPRSTWVSTYQYSVMVSTNSYSTISGACGDAAPNYIYLYSSSPSAGIGTSFYTDSGLTQSFYGTYGSENRYYKGSNGNIYEFWHADELLSINTCSLPDTTPPTPPYDVVATINSSTNDVTLDWAASTDASGIYSYFVYDNGIFISEVYTTYMIIPNACNGDHSYVIRTWDNASNFSDPSAASNTVTSNSSTLCL